MIDTFLKKNITIETGHIVSANVARLLNGKTVKLFGQTSQFDIGKMARFAVSNGIYNLISLENKPEEKTKIIYI